MKLRHILSLGCVVAAAATATAQDLNKEITIDRDIVPTQRAAARPVVFPGVTAPAVTPVRLDMEESRGASPLSPSLGFFEPARDAGMFPPTPWRGYVDLGYFPIVDIGVSAGYAILDSEATRLNIWLQADSRSYKGKGATIWDTPGYEDFKWKTFDISGGLGFSQKFGSHNLLNVSTDLAYGSHSMPALWHTAAAEASDETTGDMPSYSLGNLRWNIDGDFTGRASDSFTYGVGAGAGIYHNRSQELMWNASPAAEIPMPVNETSFRFDAWMRHQVSGNAAVRFNVDGDMQHLNTFRTPEMMLAGIEGTDIARPAGKTIGKVDFIPAFEYNGGSFYGKIGARLGLSLNSGDSFHIAPDIMLGINPDAKFGAWLKLGGGTRLNTLERMAQTSRYADPRVAYGLSDIAIDGQLGLRVGPFKGASLTLTADYAAANDWLMPFQQTDGHNLYNLFTPDRIRSWKLGAAIDWQFSPWLTVALSYDFAPGSDKADNAWLYWADRARHVIGASVSVSPLSPLTIDLGFTGRLDRRQAIASAGGLEYLNSQDYIVTEGYTGTYDLGDLTNLWAGASWRFTPALTVFARFDNILDKHSSLVFDIPAQGFTGLFGVGYKF